jgi:hypothetical protein
MIEKYLIENGERITDPSQLQPGEIYAVGYGIQGFKGFLMPERKKLRKNQFGEYGLRNLPVYSLASKCPGDKPELRVMNIDFDTITMEHLGVIRVKDVKMRKSIEEGLGVVRERSEERETESAVA